jgi:Rrf2 family transcriptional regulator, repressor of oqxAB
MGAKTPVGPGWFRISVQALVLIAESREPCSSQAISHDVSAHAVFLRRVLAQLVRTGILTAHEGRAGGYTLARPAADITLAEVYRAVKLANPPELEALGTCTSARVETVLNDLEVEVEQRVLEVFEHYTVADILQRSVQSTNE